jgi:NADH-quinone oxidoreductase subunit C
MTLEQALARLRESYAQSILSETEFRGEKSLSVKIESLPEMCRFCRDELGFDYLIDISSVDHFGSYPRYEIVYELYSMASSVHLRIKTLVPDEDNPVAPTVSDIWPTANWHEREIYDMMGIRFRGHPDLRRILCTEDWVGHPLRKDYDVGAIPVQFSPGHTAPPGGRA